MIGIIGLGFVGLTTALGLAEMTGNQVWGFEKDKEKRSIIASKNIPFFEPGLIEPLGKHLGKTFHLASSIEEVVQKSSIIFYCVGTPTGEEGHADLSILHGAIIETLSHIVSDDYKVLVIKSTVPPSTTASDIVTLIRSLGFEPGLNIGLVNNPEFLREGFSWEDFTAPDRIVIGEFDDKSGSMVAELYLSFNAPVFRVSLNTGEFIKYLSNTLLSTLISYANEMSIIADRIGEIDIKDAFSILHMDKRWYGTPGNMSTYVYPGCGFGGYCLPKDTAALRSRSRFAGYEPKVLNAVIDTNSIIKQHIIDKIRDTIKDRTSTIGILGLSFKPGSDDVRDTPAAYIIKGLLAEGFTNIIAHDPMAIDEFKKNYSFDIHYETSLDVVINCCEALIITTAWNEYRESAEKIMSKLHFDGRYCL
ncbi:MAG: putative UDP-glucose 6-dehydrogenase [Anaerosolibacter sp.]|uniref:UDP-glucose dehydrogenase family protein n=1 Tax=Anaerosolibacter sp. TaxID=1872527 RepID=UPI00260A9247|nr:nucleotide sugar dehydrogenase [Anaerosolibacter sp.]MDF2546539.1 putative UDP-glucose 6-dehydrogenase [Anaerosolibacter sp.]